MKRNHLSMLALVVLSALLLLSLTISCSSIPLKDGQSINVQYYSQGTKVSDMTFTRKDKFVLPPDPVRNGYKFNGWWVTCDQGVVEFNRDWLKQHLDTETVKVNARWTNISYSFEQKSNFAMTSTIQDGAIYKDMVFKFHSDGFCNVFNLSTGTKIGAFYLNRNGEYKPHCNAVCFGSTFYEEGDEFPLLYANIYNNYKSDDNDKRTGMVCVYRLVRKSETTFSTTLVQIIRIGFAEYEPWKSKWNAEKETFTDRSPWGNFIIDTDSNKLWAFVTRDDNHTTRFFCFDIPKVKKGDSIEVVKLGKSDINRYFDVPYSWYLQGACYHDGKIYSTEGMGTSANPTRIRVIDLKNGCEDSLVDLFADYPKDSGGNQYIGTREAEFIDYANGSFWYGDYSSSTTRFYMMKGI